MHPVIQSVCERYCIRPENLSGITRDYLGPRREAIQLLHVEGMSKEQIAREVGCHVQTVYYWTSARRRHCMRQKSAWIRTLKRDVGGRRQTKQSRDEILAAYLEDKAKGTALAVSRGLSPLYAYKLANAMGAV